MLMPTYRHGKAAEMACRLLSLHGGRMSHLKLIKLMYIVDRTALLRWGQPVTFDRIVSMPHGPVLSATLDHLTSDPVPGRRSLFTDNITRPENYEIELKSGHEIVPTKESLLSDAELDLIREVFDAYGSFARWELRDLTHTFPEWEDPCRSSVEIPLRSILERNGTTEPETDAIMAEIDAIAEADRNFA